MASKGLGPLATMRGSALAHGCGRGGRVVLPLARAAAVSTGLRYVSMTTSLIFLGVSSTLPARKRQVVATRKRS